LAGILSCASSSGGGKETIVYQEDFENGTGNWLSRYGETVGVVEGIAQSGTHSLKISKRDNTGSGAIHNFSGILLPNQTYRISAWLMFNDDSAESQTIVLTADQETEGEGHTYTNIAGERLPKGDWTYLETEYTVPRSQYELSLRLYFEGTYHADQSQAKPSDFFDFYIDNITIAKLPPAPPPEVETAIPSLYEAMDLGIPLGGTINYAYLNQNNIYNGMLRHFNAFVYGNEMKQDATEPSEGKFQLDKMNALMDYTQRVGAKMRGHVLVWHQQVPEWLFSGSGPNGLATKNELYARMKNHIQTLVSNGKGKVYAWDVCNEVVGDDGTPRDSKYHQIMVNEGLPDYDYVLQAFKWAHEADPDAILCINDYSVESSSAKQDGYYDLVQWLIEQGAPISGVGLQAHINVSWPTVADMRNCIERFASFTTVDGKKMKVQVTEFDMSIYANSGEAKKKADREVLLDQAFQYKALFDMFKQEAKLGNLDLVLIWGMTTCVPAQHRRL
jgi:endo-1,4-beta-xylanase